MSKRTLTQISLLISIMLFYIARYILRELYCFNITGELEFISLVVIVIPWSIVISKLIEKFILKNKI